MVIRASTTADIPAVVEIFTAAFWNEDAVGRFMHPRRDEFPDDVKRYWRHKIRVDYLDPQHSFIVAVNESMDEVVGVADWVWMGKNREGGLWQRILKVIAKLYNHIEAILRPNRAADPSALSAYERAAPFFAHHWEGPRSKCLSLSCLGVAPNHQGRGYGRELAQWGLNRAASEGIAASVVSSYGNEGFYRKCGFDIGVGTVTEGEGNPLSGVRGGAILFKDAPRDADG